MSILFYVFAFAITITIGTTTFTYSFHSRADGTLVHSGTIVFITLSRKRNYFSSQQDIRILLILYGLVFYSVLRLFTGFFIAAFIVFKLIMVTARTSIPRPLQAKTHQLNVVLVTKSCNQSLTLQ